MNFKFLLHFIIVAVALLPLVGIFNLLDFSVQRSYASSVQLSADLQPQVVDQPSIVSAPGLPKRLVIPKIKVNAAVDAVGITPKGEMDVPTVPRNVAWLKSGPRPGEDGSAAIAGHLNWWNGSSAAFANLSKLKAGDKIYIKDDNGVTTTFVVRLSRTYKYNENAVDVFSSVDGKAHLNLITCVGIWNKKLRSYSKRLVVFTEKE